jgi:hypothetical protein
MIWSQAVLEYLDDLAAAYGAMYRWLRPGGMVSHEIDLSAHQASDRWYGHWTYSEFQWALLRGGRPFWLNREPHSTHLRLLESAGFEIVADIKTPGEAPMDRVALAPRFRNLSSEDLATRAACVLAAKPRALSSRMGGRTL